MKQSYSLLAGAVIAALLGGCGSSSSGSTTLGSSVPVPSSVLPNSGYSVSVFTQSPGKSASPPSCAANSPKCFTGPDSIVQLGTGPSSSVFVAYQDGLNPDGTYPGGGTAQGTNQIVQYDMNGNQLAVFTVPGHNDGLMVFDSHTLWAMSNEDANPLLSVIDVTAGTVTTYSADATPAHSGGLDDMQMINGVVYASGSNPQLDTTTMLYDNPAVYTLKLNASGNTYHLTPVMLGDAMALDVISNTTVMLGNPAVPNFTNTNPAGLQDPDSMSIDSSGDLVLDSQADSELVFITNPGPSQTIKQLILSLYGNPWPVDDTRWAPASTTGLLVVDTPQNLIYKVTVANGFAPGETYSAGQGTLLLDNTSTGVMTPVVIGLNNPHGLVFLQ